MAQLTFDSSTTTMDDDRVLRQDTVYPPGGVTSYDPGNTFTQPLKALSTGTHFVQNAVFKWDTSSLPDSAAITSAIVRLYVITKDNADTRSMTMDWYVYDGTNAALDYSEPALTTANAGVTIASITSPGYNDFTLLNPNTYVSKTGTTGLRFHISGGAATGAGDGFNFVQFATIENTSFTEAQLIVDYVTSVRIAPDAIISRTNLTTWETGGVNQGTASDAQALAAIDEDPDSPDTAWLTV